MQVSEGARIFWAQDMCPGMAKILNTPQSPLTPRSASPTRLTTPLCEHNHQPYRRQEHHYSPPHSGHRLQTRHPRCHQMQGPHLLQTSPGPSVQPKRSALARGQHQEGSDKKTVIDRNKSVIHCSSDTCTPCVLFPDCFRDTHTLLCPHPPVRLRDHRFPGWL
jgi:hypothetical protein